MLAVICVRVVSEHARIPWWDFDPLVSPLPETRITPTLGLVLDAVMVVCAAGIVGAESMAGRRIGIVSGALVLAGMVGVVLHGFVLTPYGAIETLHGDTRSLTIGSAWAAAVAAGWALAQACRDPAVRRCAAGVVIGAAVPVTAIGAVQVFVEHARMVEVFDEDPEGALAAAGLSPGTPGAAAFERRMRQAEATGAFGLANVFGTIVAAGAVFFCIVTIGAVRVRARGAMWISLIGFGAGAAGLWLSGSKGAIVACVFGAGFVAVVRWMAGRFRERRWVGAVLGIGLIVVPVGAVAARGIVGERIGELSLLFRAQYAEAAGRIIADHPVFGVGPGNFKAAYLIAKNPLNPEQVESPHSVILDWVSMLGVFGVAWGILLIDAAGAIGFGLVRAKEASSTSAQLDKSKAPGRIGELVAIIAPILAVAASVGIAHGMIGQERATALLAGTGVWVIVAWAVARTGGLDRWIGWACAGAGAVAIAHGMIEVTPIMPGSAAWWAAVVGVAVGGIATRARWWNRAVGCVVALAFAVFAGLVGERASRVFVWERRLHEAWDSVVTQGGDPPAHLLTTAYLSIPEFMEIGQEACRLSIAFPTPGGFDESLAGSVVGWFPGRVEAWLMLANARAANPTRALGDTSIRDAFVQAASLDPWSLPLAVRLADLERTRGEDGDAAHWSGRALEIDDWLRLDPLVRLSPADRARMESLAGGGSEKGHPGGEP